VIGEGSTIGGSVFVTSSVPPNSVVTFTPPELRMKTKGESRSGSDSRSQSPLPESKLTSDPGAFRIPEFMPDYMI
jgi:serine acetyltransferase